MLFNSYAFIFGFLPVTLVVFFLLGRASHALAAGWLTAASLFFYGWWNPAFVGLLLVSIVFNYRMGLALSDHAAGARMAEGRRLLIFSVGINLLVLGYFKYANFFLGTAETLLGSGLHPLDIVLPLGISFFTFTQIAFLVDAHRGEVKEPRFVHYALFVSYFPHLIAGPVLHHKEMMPQFGQSSTYRFNREDFVVGATIFFIGLFKKAVLADGIAPYASTTFAEAAGGAHPALLESWGGTLAYSLQLYFDFSGYSDMAIGLSRMFGVHLPLNFNSPYQAASIIDFWRRWHMTLSRFLRDYLYIPLGGNRKGKVRRYAALMLTMLLGGLWHGAAWTFVLWGGLHGLYLVINHAWRRLRTALGHDVSQTTLYGRIGGRTLTFVAVAVAWVFFRAANRDTAFRILEGMAGLNGIAIPQAIAHHLGPLAQVLPLLGVEVAFGGGTRITYTFLWVIPLLLIALLAPNTQTIMARYAPGLPIGSTRTDRASTPHAGRVTEPALRWRPSLRWALAMAVITVCGLLSLTRPSEFLYFQF